MANCSTIDPQEVIAMLFLIAPQFQTTDPVKLASYVSLITALECMINCALLGCCAVLAFANLLAHYLTMGLNPYLGIGTSISEGQLSIGFSSTVGGNFYQSTPYGQAYYNFLNTFKVGALVSNTNYLGGFYGPACGCGY